MKLTRRAYAKINYTLSVTGVREDGYHLLDTWMQTVSLYDTVELEIADGLELVTDRFPGEQNLAFRAAALLKAESGCPMGARITLAKRIPAGAGLGGGSADAAAVLLGLNELWGLHWNRERLAKIALRLGADVPFALYGGLARCSGVGEILTPAPPIASCPMLLVFPGEGVSTVACYKQWDRSGAAPSAPCALPEKGQEEAFFASLRNDLEAPALTLLPQLGELRPAIEATDPIGCCMTGSGAAYFALYRTQAERDRAIDALACRGWELYPVEAVSDIG